MEVFRIAQEKYAHRLTASGSANRWNLPGEFVLYSGSSRSLSTLELVVHKSSIVPGVNYRVMVLSLPDDDDLFQQINVGDLPSHWRTVAAYPALQQIGSAWYRDARFLGLKIPSVIIPREHNYVINTLHPKFGSVRLVRTEDYFWDDRLL